MTIHVADRIPEIVLKRMRDGIEAVDTHTLFAGRAVLLFAVPGAFTPTCSAKHVPGYVEHFDALRKRGIEVRCTAVNDPFVVPAWGRNPLIPDGLHLLPDGNPELARAPGLAMDASDSGMGLRSRCYALYADDPVVEALFVEEPGEFKVSAADHVLQHLPD
ncbi:peroxiredoxin [Xanthomonas oryzae]|uniref:peroxiredoxin n=1 Tax=Xanthomonas oryzae TaxID=347 RepID=UPI000B419644|nr:peroxiredoxin [Xanthomonas oryzae]OWB29597.1 peroxiredoxin [Xanthomonas oryzae pv. oryzicola]